MCFVLFRFIVCMLSLFVCYLFVGLFVRSFVRCFLFLSLFCCVCFIVFSFFLVRWEVNWFFGMVGWLTPCFLLLVHLGNPESRNRSQRSLGDSLENQKQKCSRNISLVQIRYNLYM